MNPSLCALIGHDLAATEESSVTTFWLVPPSICLCCRREFEGVEGRPPASRPRDFGHFKLNTGTKRKSHA